MQAVDSLHADFAADSDLALFKLPTLIVRTFPLSLDTPLVWAALIHHRKPFRSRVHGDIGVFSGERRGIERLLQTDAPINRQQRGRW